MASSNCMAAEKSISWPYFDPNYEINSSGFTPTSVTIDNDSNSSNTVVKVFRANKDCTLLNVVQVFAYLNLSITKCDIFSDKDWFVDVFHIVNFKGNKVLDKEALEYIQESLEYKSKQEKVLAKLRGWGYSIAGSNLSFSEQFTIELDIINLPDIQFTTINGGYSVVSIQCKDRPELMYDIVCTLTDMRYVIHHAACSIYSGVISHDYFIRHENGYTLDTDLAKEHLQVCLEARINQSMRKT